MNDQLNKLRQWKCRNGHILGMVERVKVENSLGEIGHVSRLLLLRRAIDLSQMYPEEVDIIGALEGTMLHIRCDVTGCGEVRTWEIGQDAIERLMEMLSTNAYGETNKRMIEGVK